MSLLRRVPLTRNPARFLSLSKTHAWLALFTVMCYLIEEHHTFFRSKRATGSGGLSLRDQTRLGKEARRGATRHLPGVAQEAVLGQLNAG